MLPLKIAWRFLRSGKAQTLLIVVGIGIAISVQLFVGLLINSLQRDLIQSTTGNSPHITISSAVEDVTISRWENLVQRIEAIPSVKAVAVSASSNAFVKKGDDTEPILVRGFDFASANAIYNFSEAIYKGSPYRSRRDVLIGQELAAELELDVGDRMAVLLPSGQESTYSISGLYDVGTASVNKSWVITRLETAQDIFGYGNRVTAIDVIVDDLFIADAVAAQIVQMLDEDELKVENWKQLNQDLLNALQSQRLSSLMIQAFILLSVVIAISSILAITVFQKSRQIGILKAMGIKDRAASLIFIFQGLILGFMGSMVGVGIGIGLFWSFVNFATTPEGASVVEYYVELRFVLLSWAIALIAAMLAGVIPARRSLKLNPIDVIREG